MTVICMGIQMVSTLYFIGDWPIGIWRYRSGSTLAQIAACCLMAQIHYLKQCNDDVSSGSLWHSHENHFTRIHHEFDPYHVFRVYTFYLLPHLLVANDLTIQDKTRIGWDKLDECHPCWWPCSYHHQGQFHIFNRTWEKRYMCNLYSHRHRAHP